MSRGDITLTFPGPGSKTWRLSDLVALLDQIDRTSHNVRKQLERVVERVSHDGPSGYPNGSRGRRGTVNDDGTPKSLTPALALAGTVSDDPVKVAAHRLLGSLLASKEALSVCKAQTGYLSGLAASTAMRMVDTPGAVDCANPWHEYKVANTPSDPLIAGRCRPCYDYRYRYNRERPPVKIPPTERAARVSSKDWRR